MSLKQISLACVILFVVTSSSNYRLTSSNSIAGPRDQRQQQPSPLPTRVKRVLSSASSDNSTMKRFGTNSTTTTTTTHKKKFKTSNKQATSSSSSSTNTQQESTWRQSTATPNDNFDLNNNSIVTTSDNNNNNSPATWRRDVDSINGTVDLSQYERNDIDRLYGDALLVYFKNFNDTLPVRRELISINGTITELATPVGPAGRNRIPIYRSVAAKDPR